MQKRLSIIIFLISIALLSVSLSPKLMQDLVADAPYLHTSPVPNDIGNAPKMQASKISAAKLGVHVSATTPSGLYAKAYCVIDADSGRVLCGKDEDVQLPMASTTKIMTCLLALEYGNKKDPVEVSSYAASMPDVQLNIRAGEKYRLQDLLYSLMLESHNDTAVAIAEHIGGSVEGFAGMMNEKAKELGLVSTHFVTPNGLDAPDHYTTAKELCLLGACALQNEDFLKIIQTPSHSFQELSGRRQFQVHNHDAFLNTYPGAIGIKTGFTGKAGYCFCGGAKKGRQTLVSAVLACGWPPHKTYKWSDTKKLMDFGFAGYQPCEIPISDKKLSLPVLDGQKTKISLKRQTKDLNRLIIPLKATDTIRISYDLPSCVQAPVRAGDILGCENYTLDGECILQVPLTASRDVPAVTEEVVFQVLMRMLLDS